MDEYISREALLAELAADYGKWISCNDTDESYCQGVRDNFDDTIRLINELPAADVQPQESEWQIVALRTICDDIPYGHSYVCKNCGHTEGRSNKYCGGCGCKMIGVDYG